MAPTVDRRDLSRDRDLTDQNKNKMSKQSCETERKKKYDRRRIYLGTASDEWERQRCRSGLSNALFATHVLAQHASSCLSSVCMQQECERWV